jgi:hypothetical protein
MNISLGVLVMFYTRFSGETKAVNVTQKQQMFVIMSGMLITLLPYFTFPPNDMTFSNALAYSWCKHK